MRATQPVEIFGSVSTPFGTLASVDIHGKFYGDRPRGTPPSGRRLNARGVAKYSDFGPIEGSRKRCKIGSKLVLITNRTLYELSIGTKIGDLE